MGPVMAAIALAESGGCPYAKAGPVDDRPQKICTYRYTTGEDSYGLWQINRDAHPQFSRGQLYDPLGNARAAVAVLGSGPPTPWSTYTNGAYQQYLQGGGSSGPVRPGGGTDTGGGSSSPVGVFSTITGGAGDIFGRVFGGLWNAGKDAAQAVASIAQSIVFLVHFVTNPDNWLRLVEFLVGVGLILFGVAVYLRVFSSSSSAPSSAAAVAATLAREPR